MVATAPPKKNIPTGVVTLLFTDIAESSRLWELHGDAFIPVWQTHDAIMRNAIDRFGGYEVKSEGDAFMVAFSDSKAALYCAIFAQAALASYPWPTDVGGTRVRMGLHTGEPFVQSNDYFGPTVNRAAYISAAAQGGQILVSEETYQAIGSRADTKIEFQCLGKMHLKDQGMPHRLYHVFHPNMKPQEALEPSTSEAPANTSPVRRVSFVGSVKGLEHIAALLAMGEEPLLTVVGEGGMGKTRLSLESSALQESWFPDGVWYVRLSQVWDVFSVAIDIAAILHIPLSIDGSPLTEVRNWISDRQCLLILDDTHATPEVSRLIRELLSGAEHLRCIATSGKSLKIEEAEELPFVGLFDPEPNPILRPLSTVSVPPTQVRPLPPSLPTLPTEMPPTQPSIGRFSPERLSEQMNRRLGEPQRLAAESLLKTLESVPAKIEQAVQALHPSGSFHPLPEQADRVTPIPNSNGERFRRLIKKGAQKVVQAVEDAAYGTPPHSSLNRDPVSEKPFRADSVP